MIKTLEEFILNLGNSFVRDIAEKIIRKIVTKSLKITPEVELREMKAWSEGDKMTVLFTTRIQCSKEDVMKLINV